MLLSISGVTAFAQTFTAGTYTAQADGFGGAMEVAVTLNGSAIESIEVLSHGETAGISDAAFERIPAAIIEGQTLSVDTVAGCTLSSTAILTAVEAALSEAGADIDALKAKKADATAKTEETIETDVLVVGGGIAGLSAAISAADHDVSILLIDKMPALGGTSALAGGYLVAVDSELYDAAGIDDSLESTLAYWDETMSYGGAQSGYPDRDRLISVLGDTGKTVDYLNANGVPFSATPVQLGPFLSAPVDGLGAGMIASMQTSAEAKGVQIMTECKATELIVDGDAVVGVLAETADKALTIRAKSVVLATGGFSYNPEMVAELSPQISIVVPTSSVSNTGDGIVMAQAIGAGTFDNFWSALSTVAANTKYTSTVEGAAALSVPAQLGVNAKGERFASELSASFTALTYDMIIDGNAPFYYIFDSSDETKIAAMEGGIELGEVVKGDTIEDLAAAIGADPAVLAATFARYNEQCVAGADADFAKPADYLVELSAAPYYGVKFYPTTFGSTGGVLSDNDGRVLRQDASVISGLYAAGEMSNRYYYNRNYVLSASLGLYATMGIRAGNAAATDIAK